MSWEAACIVSTREAMEPQLINNFAAAPTVIAYINTDIFLLQGTQHRCICLLATSLQCFL